MIVNPYYFALDDLNLGTVAHNLEVLAGLKQVPDKRTATRHIASRHGAEDPDEYYSERVLNLLVTMFPNGPDGSATAGDIAELHANWDRLVSVISKRGPIDVRHKVPAVALPPVDDDSSGSSSSSEGSSSSSSSGGLLELQGDGRVVRAVVVDGDAKVWRVGVELAFRWPFWHELPKVELEASTSHEFFTGGTAPVANMVFKFTEDAVVTDQATGHAIGISGMQGSEVVVDVRRRKVFEDGVLAMGLLRLGSSTPDYWMEWPARTNVSLTATAPVAVEFHRSRF